ncbi:MAG: TonB-dependent receptor [Chitinophagaceae bacterium]|nr:TonB-dependent receptor [Chitinophagaceae bacterium]
MALKAIACPQTRGLTKKLLLIMNFTAILLLCGSLALSAAGFSQKVTLSAKNAKLEKVFRDIKKQTGYGFLYTYEILGKAQLVTLSVKDAELPTVLELLFSQQPLSWSIVEKTVVIKPKPEKINSPAIAQQDSLIDVTGTISNEDGDMLSGVSVGLKGSQLGATTDANGNYTLRLSELKGTLVFSHVSYEQQEVLIGNRRNINIVMKAKVADMDQVVVVGYGQMKRRDLTGSVATVRSADIVKSPEMSLNTALQGRAAGVQVTSNDGAPGSNVSILVRAGSSISASNEPLYVIDGFPQLGGSNNNINPNDVESVEILKDASATAIYGSRGANGVIIITTKSGKAGKFSVSYDGYYSIQALGVKRDVMNTLQYAEVQHYMLSNPKGSGIGDTVFYNWPDYKDSTSTDWQDKIYRIAPMQNHNVSFTGGSENLRISGSVGYTGQDGIAIGTNFKRYTARISTIARISKRVSNHTIIYLSRTDQSGPPVTGSGGITYSAVKVSPYRPAGTDLNNYLAILGGPGGANGRDPYVDLMLRQIKSLNNQAMFNSSFDITLAEDLVLKLAGGVTYAPYTTHYFYPTESSSGANTQGAGGQSGGDYIGLLNENTLNYKKNIGNHSLNALAGFTVQTAVRASYSMSAQGFPIQSMGYDNLGVANRILPPETNRAKSGIVSYLGRVNYGFLDKYLLTASMRADGSSKFPKNKWGYFPSVGLAWKIDQENFMKALPAISTLKLRATWGKTGNESVPSYSSYTTYGTFYPGFPVVVDDRTAVGFGPTQLGNADLRWETTIQSNIAVDLGILKDRVLITAEVYNKKSQDLLLNAPLSQYSGFTSVLRNVGDIQVKGFELALNTVNLKGKFGWSTNFNIASNVSKVLRLNDGQTEFYIGKADRLGDAYVVRVGQSLGAMFGYVYDGIVNTSEELAAAPIHISMPTMLGERKYKDISGPDGKPDNQITALDRTVIGNGNPKFFGGFSNDFRYGPFELSALFTYSYGNDILNAQKTMLETPYPYQGGLVSIFNRWTSQAPQTNAPRWSGLNNEFTYSSSYVVEDGSYLRLKNVVLAYNLPVDRIKRSPVKRLRVYISAQNLLTFTRYTGYDPEINTLNSIITAGSDVSGYPRNKIYTLGLNVDF